MSEERANRITYQQIGLPLVVQMGATNLIPVLPDNVQALHHTHIQHVDVAVKTSHGQVVPVSAQRHARHR